MKYRNKVTGEIVETPMDIPKNAHEALLDWYIWGQFIGKSDMWKDFFDLYEPCEEPVKEDANE